MSGPEAPRRLEPRPARRLLLVITKADWGGAQRYVFDLATSLPRHRYAPIVALGPAQAAPGRQRDSLEDRLATAAVPVRRIAGLQRDVSALSELQALRDLVSLFRREAPAVVHLTSSKAGGIGALAARLARVPRIVYTVHGWPFREPRGAAQQRAILAASWLSCLLAHRVIVVSRGDFESARLWPVVGRRVSHVPCSIRSIDFLERRGAREALASWILGASGVVLPPDGTWIGSVAELHRNKGLESLVEAFATMAPRHPEARVLIIGEGEERAALEARIRAHGLSGRVLLCGFLSEAARYLKALDVLALPSLKEGLPYVVLEAAAAGVAIVASRVGGIPDLLVDGRNARLVSPASPGELARAIGQLLESPDLRARLASAARREVPTSDGLEPMLTRTLQIYDDEPA